jgi:hypothetical protein
MAGILGKILALVRIAETQKKEKNQCKQSIAGLLIYEHNNPLKRKYLQIKIFYYS